MADDFRVKVNFFGHRKTKKLRKRIGNDGILCLIQLWADVAASKPDGDISEWCVEDIEISASWEGEDGAFVSAAVEAGFIDNDESGYSLHDWTDHNPWVADAVTRSDSSRLSRMAATHPEIYQRLVNEGRKGISEKEYWALTHDEGSKNDTQEENNERLTTVNESLNEALSDVKATLSPSPTPAPAPSPVPVPKDPGTCTIAPDFPDTTPEEREILHVIQCAKGGYQYDFEKDLKQIRTLSVEFPDVDMLAQVKLMSAWLIDQPPSRVKNSRAFMRNWISKAKPALYKPPRSPSSDVYASAAARDPDEIMAGMFGQNRDSPNVIDADFEGFEEVSGSG